VTPGGAGRPPAAGRPVPRSTPEQRCPAGSGDDGHRRPAQAAGCAGDQSAGTPAHLPSDRGHPGHPTHLVPARAAVPHPGPGRRGAAGHPLVGLRHRPGQVPGRGEDRRAGAVARRTVPARGVHRRAVPAGGDGRTRRPTRRPDLTLALTGPARPRDAVGAISPLCRATSAPVTSARSRCRRCRGLGTSLTRGRHLGCTGRSPRPRAKRELFGEVVMRSAVVPKEEWSVNRSLDFAVRECSVNRVASAVGLQRRSVAAQNLRRTTSS